MELKKLKNTFKKNLVNQITKKGKKQIIEKEFTKSLKQAQKKEKKNLSFTTKQLTLSKITPFKFVKLTNKRRRKKTIKEIPKFLSHETFRFSWGLKNITNFSNQKEIQYKSLRDKLLNKVLTNTNKQNDTEISEKALVQEKALKEKRYFRYYRW